jgi:hypothetical protein
MNSNVFKIGETERFKYFVVRFEGRPTYDVVYDKDKETYHCDCKNIRLGHCKHIKRVISENITSPLPESL